jgi:hypothetical protein
LSIKKKSVIEAAFLFSLTKQINSRRIPYYKKEHLILTEVVLKKIIDLRE